MIKIWFIIYLLLLRIYGFRRSYVPTLQTNVWPIGWCHSPIDSREWTHLLHIMFARHYQQECRKGHLLLSRRQRVSYLTNNFTIYISNLSYIILNYLILNRTPVGRKERAEDYPKNFALLKMAEKYRKK